MFKNNYVWICLALALFVALVFPIQDSDLFFYLSMGRLIFETGSIPSSDPFLFSFKDWHVYHEWLAYIFFYGAYWLAGYAAVIMLKTFLWMSGFAGILYLGRRWKVQDEFIILILFFTIIACCHRFVERASLFSDLLLAFVTGYYLRPEKTNRLVLWMMPLIFVFWVNTHGGYPAGLFVFSGYVVLQGRKAKAWLWLSLVLSYLACLLNPDGIDGALYPFKTILKPEWAIYRSINTEWLPTFKDPFLSTWEVRSLIILILLTAGGLVYSFKKNPKQNIFPLFIFAINLYLAQNASRFMSTSALGFSLIALSCFRNLKIAIPAKIHHGLIATSAALFLTFAVWSSNYGYTPASGLRVFGVGIDTPNFPVKAAEFIKKQNLQGRFFNQYEWGSYFIWTLEGGTRSFFIHSHIDNPLYLKNDYYGMSRSPEFFDQAVKKYGINYFVLDRGRLASTPPPAIAVYLARYKLIYDDGITAIWQL